MYQHFALAGAEENGGGELAVWARGAKVDWKEEEVVSFTRPHRGGGQARVTKMGRLA